MTPHRQIIEGRAQVGQLGAQGEIGAWSSAGRGPVGAKEHRAVVRAIQDHDAAKAAEIMRRYLGRTARRVKNV